jgi:hypothetical protein
LRPSDRQAFAERVRGETPSAVPAPAESQQSEQAASKPAALEELKKAHRSDRRSLPLPRINFKLAGVIGAAAVIVLIGGLALWHHGSKEPLSATVRKQAGFPLYYPSEVPAGYTLKQDSVRLDNGIVFYSLVRGAKTILFSQQEVPTSPPDLAHLQGFKKVTTFNGDDVAVGTSNGQPTALLLTDTTLITVTGSKDASKDAIFKLAQDMQPLSTSTD